MVIKNHVRSISFPSRSHPSTLAIEEGLYKLLAMEISDSICGSLSALEELYKCTDDLLNIGSTQKVLSEHRNMKFLDEMLDGSLRLMDICSVSRDLMLETGEEIRVLQSGVRRRKGDFDVVSSYLGFRKNMKKQTRKLIVSVKQIENRIGQTITDDQDEHLVAVVDAMRRVVSVSVSILNSFFDVLLGHKVKNKWSLVLMKMLQKDMEETCKKKRQKNEFESMDSMISSGEYSPEVLHMKLEEMERSVLGFEKNLEGLFRRLIRTRASLLNIISQ